MTDPSSRIRWTRRAHTAAYIFWTAAYIFWTVCILAGGWLIPGLLNELIR